MKEHQCNNDSIPTLSEEAAQEILGDNLVFLVAFGADGKAIPFRPKRVNARILDLNNFPIQTEQIFKIEPAALVTYSGSTKCTWKHGGVEYEFWH